MPSSVAVLACLPTVCFSVMTCFIGTGIPAKGHLCRNFVQIPILMMQNLMHILDQ